MKTWRLTALAYLLFFSASLILQSCTNNSASTPPLPPTVPTPGSTFVQVWYGGYYDTSSVSVDSTVPGDPTDSGAKVIKLRENDKGQLDSTYQSFKSDGDVALEGTAWGAPGAFEVLPFVSKSVINSSYSDASGLVTVSAVSNGAGKDFNLNGIPYFTDSVTVFRTTGGLTDQFHYTYIPMLGLVSSVNYQPDSSGGSEGNNQWIISYVHK